MYKPTLIENLFFHIVVPLRNLLRYNRKSVFTSIAIETTSWCNRKCEYCPNSKYKREKKTLDFTLVKKVAKQLGDIDYDGAVFLHLFNEPLLDKRLSSIITCIREECQKAKIAISSNGDILTTTMMRELLEAGLDKMFVTQYDGRIKENVERVQQYITEKNCGCLHVRVQNVFNNNRGGSLDFMKVDQPLKEVCYRPDRMLTINSDGKVVICCNDYHGQEIMGDVNKEKLLDIWNNEQFRHFRRHLRRKDRTVSPLCRSCNEIVNWKRQMMTDLSKSTPYRALQRLFILK